MWKWIAYWITYSGSLFSAIYTVGIGGNYTTLPSAVSSAIDGDTLVLLAGNTFDLGSSPCILDKELTIQGENRDTCIIRGSSVGNIGILHITHSNVTLNQMTLEQTNTSNAFAITTTVDLDGLLFDSLTIRTAKYGLGCTQSSFTISNSKIIATGSVRCYGILVYKSKGDSWITNNVFDNQGSNVTNRFILVSDGPHSGTLTINNNTQTDTVLHSFFLMESFNGPANSFSLIFDSNVYSATGNSITFYSSIDNPLDLFSVIQATNNQSLGIAGNKGFICIDGPNPNVSIGTDPSKKFILYQNTALPISNPDFSSATDNQLISYNNTTFTNPPHHIVIAPYQGSIHYVIERFATQGDHVQIVSWENTDADNQTRFRIYQGSTLLAEVDSASYEQHLFPFNTSSTYEVAAIDNAGTESLKIIISD